MDIKNIDGGLRDIEFAAQYLMLKLKPANMPRSTAGMLSYAKDEGIIQSSHIDKLMSALIFYQTILQIFAVTIDGKFNPETASGPLTNLLAQAVGCKTFLEVEGVLKANAALVRSIFQDIFKLSS